MGRNQPITRGDIWLINLDPTIGHEINKTRPGIIIQNDIGNAHSPTTIIAPITTNTENIYPQDVYLPKTITGKEAKILCGQIRTIDKKRLVKKLATLDNLEELNQALKISLGLSKLIRE